MDHYLMKHRRDDKTTDELEYQKAAGELTFHPKISSAGPKVDYIRESSVSPANMQRNNTYN
jgi:hypothetical protein